MARATAYGTCLYLGFGFGFGFASATTPHPVSRWFHGQDHNNTHTSWASAFYVAVSMFYVTGPFVLFVACTLAVFYLGPHFAHSPHSPSPPPCCMHLPRPPCPRPSISSLRRLPPLPPSASPPVHGPSCIRIYHTHHLTYPIPITLPAV